MLNLLQVVKRTNTPIISQQRDVNGDSLMDVMVGASGSSYLEKGAAHVVYGTNTSGAYESSFLDLGGSGGAGLNSVDGFTLSGIEMEADIYAKLVSAGDMVPIEKKSAGTRYQVPGTLLKGEEWNGVAPFRCLGSPGMRTVGPRQ